MPPREPKSRRMDREYMQDRDFMTTYTADEREWYMLTAMFADDGGWLDWDLPEMAASQYRYEDPQAREKRVESMAQHFIETKRLQIFKCGHAFMQRVANRPRGHAREYAVRDAHELQCKSKPSASKRKHSESTDDAPEVLSTSVPNRNLTVAVARTNLSRDQTGGRARPHEENGQKTETKEPESAGAMMRRFGFDVSGVRPNGPANDTQSPSAKRSR